MSGLSLAGAFGLREGGQAEIRVDIFPETTTESGDVREFKLVSPQVNWRQRLIGRETNLAWILGGGVGIYSQRALAAAPKERTTIPFLSSGLGLQLHLTGAATLEVRSGIQVALARQNALGLVSGGRSAGVSPWIQVTLWAMPRRRDTQLPSSNLPLSSQSDFLPVTSRAVPSRTATELLREPAPVAPLLSSARRNVRSQMIGQVQYAVGATAVPPTAYSMLESIADFLVQQPASTIELVAYTDPLGGIAANQSVAERRGTEVREHLVRLLGVAENRIVVRAMGHDPVSSRTSARRVEIYAITPDQQER